MSKLKYIISYLLLLVVFTGATVGASLAWLHNITADVDIDADGDILASYFHTGNGTEGNPYVITTPEHLYNLTQLYKLRPNIYATANTHYQLGYDLDDDGDLEFYNYNDNGEKQSGYSEVLNMNSIDYIPIGDAETPFVSQFDGSNLTIDKLHINGHGKSDIGFFGYVDEDAEIKDVYLNNLTINVEDAEAGNHTGHSNTYVGYLAGHIEKAQCFTNTFVNNCEILGENSNVQNEWGYFGHCQNADTIQAFIEQASGQGHGNDWGGSIDMHSLNNRLYNHLNSTSAAYSTKGYYGKYDGTYTKISVYRGDKASTYYKKDPNTNQVFYNLMGNGAHTKNENYTLPGTYIPLLENADGTIPEKNTGYIVSDSEALNSANGTIRSASYQVRYIANSLVSTNATDAQVYSGSGSAASVSYTSSNLEILTNKGTTYSNNNYYLIKDSHNSSHSVSNTAISGFTKSDATTPTSLGFKKYTEARTALDEVLTGKSFIHGIHFMGSAISTSKTITATTAIVNGETKSNYVLPKSCIDFTLKEAGIINFFGGSYYARTNSSYADSFFTLNYITRNANGSLNTIKQINNIYENTNTADGQPKYVYQFSDNSYSTGTRGNLLFNMNFIMNEPPAHNALYYFEIPANEGEYALGTVSGKTGGGYLMYLDIGASGEDQTEQLVDDFKTVEYRTVGQELPVKSILLITYNYTNTIDFNIKVAYVETKRYNITISGNAPTIQITLLDLSYQVWVNGSQLIYTAIGTQTYLTS